MRWRTVAFGMIAMLAAGCGTTPGGTTPGGAGTGVVSTVPVTGTVRGMFEMEGGPVRLNQSQPPVRPLSGVVSFTGSGGQRIDVAVGKAGTFSVTLPAGTYSVSGRSGAIKQQNRDGSSTEPPCSQPLTAKVLAGRTTRITVTCVVP